MGRPIKYDAAEYYRIVKEDGGKTPVSDLAASVNQRTPNFVNYVMQYMFENQIAMTPNFFVYSAPKPTSKIIRRVSVDTEPGIRVSALQLKSGGMGHVLDFKAVKLPTQQAILLVPAEAPILTLEECIKYLRGQIRLEAQGSYSSTDGEEGDGKTPTRVELSEDDSRIPDALPTGVLHMPSKARGPRSGSGKQKQA